MRKFQCFAVTTFVACSMLTVAAQRSVVMTPAEMERTIGADGGDYCWDNGSCDALAASCNGASMCSNIGDQCGVERELQHAETCATQFGNEYCDSSNAVDVEVVCATEVRCICTSGVPIEGELVGAMECHPDETFGSTNVRGIIRTDTLTCQYDAWVQQ